MLVFLAALALCQAQPAPEGRALATLEPGKTAERSLSPRAPATSWIHVPLNHFSRLRLEPNGLDLSAVLRTPAGDKIAEVANPAGEQRPISISWMGSVEGDYSLQVTLRGKLTGRYRVTLSELRIGESRDLDRISAERSFAEGRRLRLQPSRAAFLQAIERFQSAVALWRQLNDPGGEADALSQIGSVYNALSDPQKAIEFDQQALPLRRASSDLAGEGELLNNIAVAYTSLGDTNLALENLRRALPLRRESGDLAGVAETLHNLTAVYETEGEFQLALNSEQEALTLYRTAGDRIGEATAFNGMGVVLFRLGETERAIENQRQALQIHRELEDRRSQAIDLTNVGTAYLRLEQPATALELLSSALEMHRQLGSRQGEATTLQNIGQAYFQQGDHQKARENYEHALALQKALQAPRPQAFVLNLIASSHLEAHQPKEALERLRVSLNLARMVGDRKLEASVLAGVALAQWYSGNLEEALAQIDASVRLSETLRGAVASPDLRTSYLASVHDRYGLWIDILTDLAQRHPQEGFELRALEVSERARARSLLDLLGEARTQIREGVDPELADRERSVRAALDEKTDRQIRLLGGAHTPEQAASMDKEIQALATRYQDVEAEIRARSPRYASLTQPEPLTAPAIQKLLDENTVLLEYALGKQRSFLWLVTPASVRSFLLPRQEEIETAARQAYRELGVNSPAGGSAARALSRILLAPLAGQLAGKRLVLVTDGALQYIPFAALTMPGEREELIAGHQIVHLPSASTLALLRGDSQARLPAPRLVALLADPVFDAADPRVTGKREVPAAASESGDLQRSAKDAGLVTFERLRSSRDEADAVARLAGRSGSLIAVDFDASKEAATSPELSQYRIVHFATHGLVNSKHPELSGLVFSLVDRNGKPRNGFLTASEIFNLKLRAGLVVLSACQTALGKEVRGEGLMGLTRGFMYAGAPRVVASLWRVPDRGTAELMKRFYEGMLVKAMPPAAALRAAQLALRKDPRWAAPYNWAGFTLQGEWN
jgi:CHAT domain-containing protein/tetratricopeptide (TPR) repeat protein